MTWLNKYRKSLHFASLFSSKYHRDIVHDAWVYYMEKTGLDLFEVQVKDFDSYLYTVIKKAFYRWYYKERRGEKYLYFSTDTLQSAMDSPEEITFAHDLYAILLDRVKGMESNNNNTKTGRLDEIFRLRSFGYTQQEVAEELGLSKQVINYYNNKIKMLNNPINGSKLKITKQISLSTWQRKTDREDYELDDHNEFYQVYQHKESKEGLLVRLPAAKTNPYIK